MTWEAEEMTGEELRWQRYKRYNATQKGKGRRPIYVPKPFVGVDGEGGNVGGEHIYPLLRAGESTIVNRKGLTLYQALGFLANLNRDFTYVAYFFDYDVTMMVKHMRTERLERLLNPELRTVERRGKTIRLPLDYDDYQLDYLPRKYFRVREKGGDWRTINDVGTFFQCSFVKALELWEIGTTEQRKAIAKGKEQRSTFGELSKETEDYNELECKLLAQLMETFREVQKYRPQRWQGPGELATAVLKAHRVPRTKEYDIPAAVLEGAQSSYYGGRFEVAATGLIPGPITQLDINSAYPHAMTYLPCLVHGQWTEQPLLPKEALYLAFGHFLARYKERPAFMGLPVRRDNGTIMWPASGRGWYWSWEIEAARDWQAFIPEQVWKYQTSCQCKPFDFVPAMYEERLRLGKDRRGYAAKLQINSLYGKLCQSVGKPAYANPIWASLITAHCRAKVYAMARWAEKLGHKPLMIATDGLFLQGDPQTMWEGNKELGGWSIAQHDWLFIVQPGLYWTTDTYTKTRGVPLSVVLANKRKFYGEWDQWLQEQRDYPNLNPPPSVPLKLTGFIGARLAMARGKPETMGKWVEETRNVSFEWHNKRTERPYQWHDTWVEHGICRGDPKRESMPYSRDIGRWRDSLKLEDSFGQEDWPDWAPYVLSGEG